TSDIEPEPHEFGGAPVMARIPVWNAISSAASRIAVFTQLAPGANTAMGIFPFGVSPRIRQIFSSRQLRAVETRERGGHILGGTSRQKVFGEGKIVFVGSFGRHH